MNAAREQRISDTFAQLTGGLINGEDVNALLDLLTGRCAELLNVTSAGLLLADSRHALHVMAASSAATRDLEILQVQGADGPCRDCYLTGEQVLIEDLAAHADRWPQFVPAALQAGFRSVHAVPMRLRSRTLGALGLFGSHVGRLNERDLSLAQSLADVATISVVQDRGAADRNAVNEQLQAALDSRIVLEQAKGFLAQSGDADTAEAFTLIFRYARDHNLKLTDVARALIERTVPASVVLGHAAA